MSQSMIIISMASIATDFGKLDQGITAESTFTVDYAQLILISNQTSGAASLGFRCRPRITVRDVLEYLASGMSAEEILSDFPDLTAGASAGRTWRLPLIASGDCGLYPAHKLGARMGASGKWEEITLPILQENGQSSLKCPASLAIDFLLSTLARRGSSTPSTGCRPGWSVAG